MNIINSMYDKNRQIKFGSQNRISSIEETFFEIPPEHPSWKNLNKSQDLEANYTPDEVERLKVGYHEAKHFLVAQHLGHTVIEGYSNGNDGAVVTDCPTNIYTNVQGKEVHDAAASMASLAICEAPDVNVHKDLDLGQSKLRGGMLDDDNGLTDTDEGLSIVYAVRLGDCGYSHAGHYPDFRDMSDQDYYVCMDPDSIDPSDRYHLMYNDSMSTINKDVFIQIGKNTAERIIKSHPVSTLETLADQFVNKGGIRSRNESAELALKAGVRMYHPPEVKQNIAKRFEMQASELNKALRNQYHTRFLD